MAISDQFLIQKSAINVEMKWIRQSKLSYCGDQQLNN